MGKDSKKGGDKGGAKGKGGDKDAAAKVKGAQVINVRHILVGPTDPSATCRRAYDIVVREALQEGGGAG